MRRKYIKLFTIGALTCFSAPLENSKLFPPDPFTGVHETLERCENEEVICYMLFHMADVNLECFPKNHAVEMKSKIQPSEKLAEKWLK